MRVFRMVDKNSPNKSARKVDVKKYEDFSQQPAQPLQPREVEPNATRPELFTILLPFRSLKQTGAFAPLENRGSRQMEQTWRAARIPSDAYSNFERGGVQPRRGASTSGFPTPRNSRAIAPKSRDYEILPHTDRAHARESLAI